MYRYIWLVPLLPLIGAAINGIFGRWFRFSEKLVGGIAVGSVALSFLISVAAVVFVWLWRSCALAESLRHQPDGAFKFDWIHGGAVRRSLRATKLDLTPNRQTDS